MSEANKVHRFLPNGMEVYLHKTDFAPVASVQVWVKAGSIDEEPQEFGVAHVLEHMLFKGTKKFPLSGQVASLVEFAGGDVNAYTTFDHTVYYFTAPSSFVKEGAELLLDVVQNSLLDPEELRRELEVVVEEIRRGRDNPNSILSQNLFKHLFRETAYERPIIGYEDIVKSFNYEIVSGFYRKWYAPNNMIFVAAGDFEPQEMYEYLVKLSESFKPITIPERLRPPLPKERKEAGPVSLIRGPFQEARVQVATRAPTLEDDECAAWEMFASILGNGDSSRLSHVLKDQMQLVTSISSGTYNPSYPGGLFSIGIFARVETVLQAISVSLEEVIRLNNDGPTPQEMGRVLSAMKASYIYAAESVDGISKTVGNSLLTSQKLRFDELYLEKLSRVTSKDVKNVASKIVELLSDNQFVVSCAVSKEEGDVITEESIRQAIFHGLKSTQKILNGSSCGYRASAKPSELNEDLKQISFDLPKGKKLRINYRESTRLPIVSGAILCRGGLTREAQDRNGICSLLSDMMTRGTTKQSYKEFVSELEDNSSSISAYCSKDITGVRIDSLEEHGYRTLEMALDCLFRPAFHLEEYERVQREALEIVIAQKDSPSSRLSRLSGPLLFGDHPYSRSTTGTEESIEKISLEDVREHWKRIFSADEFIVSLAGKFDCEKYAEYIHLQFVNFLDDLQIAQLFVPAVSEAPLPQPSHQRVGFEEFEREQAHILFSFRAFPLADKRRTALDVAASILGGQGGRLFLDLRDKRSLAYSVGASHSASIFGGVFSSYIASQASKTQEAIEGLKYHIEELAKNPPSEEEILRAQKSLIGGQSIDAQHHHYQATQLAMSDVYGLGFDNFLRFAERIKGVTAQMVQETLASLLLENPPVISIVGPKGTWVPQANEAVLAWNLKN